MNITELKNNVTSGLYDNLFVSQCGILKDNVQFYRNRILSLADEFTKLYDNSNSREVSLFSVGGRSEISGNHTDHNYGKVIAAAINLDVLAIASKSNNGIVRIKSEGFPEDIVNPMEIYAPNPNKFFKSSAIIAGMESAFVSGSKKVGGFDAVTTSNVLKGSGLSSSAAFEVMVGNIINHLYNNGEVDNVTIAKMAQYAENKFFGKPCGLMDQTACAVGGLITIDFKDTKNPIIEKIDFDMAKAGYALCIVSTGGNHADLNDDYASIPKEMKSVAEFFGKKVLRECLEEDVIANAAKIRETLGDRALLRALHFFEENVRVTNQVASLKSNDIDAFFSDVIKSGNSSYKYLQNVFTTKNVNEQGLSLALCLTDKFLQGKKAAHRVHGGGFAGTIQAFIPFDLVEDYKKYMDNVFGDGACMPLSIRMSGAIKLA